MIKNGLTFVIAITLTMGVFAGGDDRDKGPVESLEVMAPNTLNVAGKSVSVRAHIACQGELGLKDSNIAIFRRAQADGNLYNTGPVEGFGTGFSPQRWDRYFACVSKNGG
ncbi:MAG: hypothetical protein FXV79_03560 [Candidatus Thioglobus sp.]|nr:MAG: hypothetical protein FXV80_05045 [Candidatus Thioglobus sp.]KAA0449844.1 MAG: hypothetical protein FXV79_03560 [Candidatus Thioglobus sp.]